MHYYTHFTELKKPSVEKFCNLFKKPNWQVEKLGFQVSYFVLKSHAPYAKTYTLMFIAAFFIIAQTWKQQRLPLEGEWLSKLWDIQTVKFYSALKVNEIPSHEKT